MFCNQCEQVSKGGACTKVGVCGKGSDVSALQDLLVYSLQGLSLCAAEARKAGIVDAETDEFTVGALFSTLTNVNFDAERFAVLINKSVELREKMKEWRAGERITKIEKPTRIDRARALGYKAKKGVVVARVVIARGGRKKPRINKKRRTKRQNTRKSLKMNYKWIAEQKAGRKFKNLEVLNSYKLAKDGKFFYLFSANPF